MASQWGKFLAPITVPTAGWAFVFVDGAGSHTATVAAGTYDTIFHLCSQLATKIDAEIAGSSTITVSSVGIVAIEMSGFLSITYASCADDLLTALGYAETETVSSDTITASTAHRWGWYPGTITYGSTDGEGLADDTGWQTEDVWARSIAGSGSARIIGPSRMPYTRQLVFGALHRDECLEDRNRGPVALMDRWASSALYWYPDRDVGTVASTGTQGDPGPSTYHTDDDCDYWKVTLKAIPAYGPSSAQHPDYFRISLTLNAEPA